jgi:hypothetical protein
MDYRIFRKQAYTRTGGQRDSTAGVTNSIQNRDSEFRLVRPKTLVRHLCAYVPLVRWETLAVPRPAPRPLLWRIRDLDMMVIQQISGRVIQLRNGQLVVHLGLNDIYFRLRKLRLRIQNEKDLYRA